MNIARLITAAVIGFALGVMTENTLRDQEDEQ